MAARRSSRLKRSAGRPKALENFVTDFDTQTSESSPPKVATTIVTSGESDLESESGQPMTAPDICDFVLSPERKPGVAAKRAADSTSGIYNVSLSSSDEEEDEDPYMACYQLQKKKKVYRPLPSWDQGRTPDNTRDGNHNKSQANSENLNLHLSDDESDCGDDGDDESDVVLLSEDDDGDDRVSPNSKVTWRDLSQLTVKCGPVLTDLTVMFPNVSWATVGPLVVKLMGRKGQQVQVIKPQQKAKKSQQQVISKRPRRNAK